MKYFVLSGGGIRGIFTTYGVLRAAHERGEWSRENLCGIYGTSAGSIVALFMSLLLPQNSPDCWTEFDTFLIERPWHRIVPWSAFVDLAGAVSRGGLLDKSFFVDAFAPILRARDMDENATLADVYHATGVDLHMFCVELTAFRYIDMSYKTHPDMRVLDAIYRSCCIPVVFAPDYDAQTGEVFLDGSIMQHYALQCCLKQTGCSMNEIIGVRSLPFDDDDTPRPTTTPTMFDVLSMLCKRTFAHMNEGFGQQQDKMREYTLRAQFSLEDLYTTLCSAERRRDLIFNPHQILC